MNAPAIHLITLRATQVVVVVPVNSHEKISVIDVMTARSEEAGMNHLRPAEMLAGVLTRVDTIDTKTELSATSLAFRGVILLRQTTNLQMRTSALQFVASQSGGATENSNRNDPKLLPTWRAPLTGVVLNSKSPS